MIKKVQSIPRLFLEDYFQKYISFSQEYFLLLKESKKKDYIAENFFRTIDKNFAHYGTSHRIFC